MGGTPVSYFSTASILLVAYLAIFLESSVGVVRNWIGAQIDILPVLMVYCGFNTGLITITLTAVLGGLWFDALSANPLGISVLPLFLIGFTIHKARDLILRDQAYARVVFGVAASATAPVLTVLFLWGGGYKPLVGWGSLWQWVVLCLAGGTLTPACFWFFERVNKAMAYSQPVHTSFRPDREIKRGRA
jgi:cell shape-determining protein MreD